MGLMSSSVELLLSEWTATMVSKKDKILESHIYSRVNLILG